ncbi:hypothetical protein [Actinomarinicola tropica]|uniref:Uncharacterized protein n=1 Tax=Actinomarinicola tropica TaxID=2789776 RepID=A0A5Q2RKX7_9ACTN|nr:hypothetical protein [Actinomarinicola tropica]QGG94510.1 hypothetical protein GH723_04990 [Actinomarinicola tropica]
MQSLLLLATDSPLGDGAIDNYVIDSSVHVTTGVLVLVAMVATTIQLWRLALAGKGVDRLARVLLAAAQITLAVQALLGIKLLDQGQGVVQLYIHYLGGLAPLGLFIAAGWFAWRDRVRHTRVLAVLATIGLVSAVMAFTIGQEYANRGV